MKNTAQETIDYLLEMRKTQEKLLAACWLRNIAGALYLESILPEVSKLKPILTNVPELPELDAKEVEQWTWQTYDVYHPLRNNVELIDSIESVRLYLKEKDAWVGNILELKE